MNPRTHLPQHVQQIAADETFTFDCNPETPCFTECCRQLELALSPYDVLRLCRATGLQSDEFLDRYVIIEQDNLDVFPRFYLTMIDNERESCVFVSPKGCDVYEHRPSACRTYPMGRGVRHKEQGLTEFFVLLKEDHCQGFVNSFNHTPRSYLIDQELETYNRYNDACSEIQQRGRSRPDISFNQKQIEVFILALYNLDRFKKELQDGKLSHLYGYDSSEFENWTQEQLLLYGIQWIQNFLFNELTQQHI